MKQQTHTSSADILAELADDAAFQQQYRSLIRLPEYAWLLDGPIWWTPQQIATGLAISPKTIHLACQRRQFPYAYCVGGRGGWRIPFSRLIRWLYAHHERKG